MIWAVGEFPTPLSSYPSRPGATLIETLTNRVAVDPFNAVATGIFLLAVLHTFVAPRLAALAHSVQHRHDGAGSGGRDEPRPPAMLAEALHFLGEVEVVFGLWVLVLIGAITAHAGFGAATHDLDDTVNYTEPLFVVVIMALAATRPIVLFAEGALRAVASVGRGTPAAWWLTILTVAPLKVAVVAGAVTGGGLTVIANARNPAGQAILARFFGDGISPLYLLLGALVPTLIAAMVFPGLRPAAQSCRLRIPYRRYNIPG